MKDTELLSTGIPPVTSEFYEHLKASFPEREIKPSTPVEEIMYRAGQQSVVRFVNRSVVGKTVTGKPQNWLHRFALKYWRDI